MSRFVILLIALVALAGCGTKSDLETPSGKTTPANEHDPSKPPHPLGE